MEDAAVQRLLKELAEKAKDASKLEVSHLRQADAYKAERVAFEFAHDKLLNASNVAIVAPLAEPDVLPAVVKAAWPRNGGEEREG
jgi:hypothetical protein